MNPFDPMTGDLELAVGTAWLSRFELSRLVPGSVILTDRIAGTGFELRFNGARLADADAILAELPGEARALGEARVSARISRFDRDPSADAEPLRGPDLLSLLPVTVSLGRVRVALDSLSGLGRMSVIELGIPARKEGAAWLAEAALYVAGTEAGRGIVAVSGETMALDLTETAPSFPPPSFGEAPFASTGRVLSPGAETARVKRYDFSKPDFFTRRQLESLSRIHEDALRSLSLIAGVPPGLRIRLADQLNFTEYLESLPSGERVMAAPASAATRAFMADGERPAKAFLAAVSPDPRYPRDAVAAGALAAMARPVGGSVLVSGPLADADSDAFLEALRDAWRRFGSLSPRPGPAVERTASLPESSLAFAPYAGEWEMVALMEIVSDRGHELTVAYPQRTLEAVMRALDA